MHQPANEVSLETQEALGPLDLGAYAVWKHYFNVVPGKFYPSFVAFCGHTSGPGVASFNLPGRLCPDCDRIYRSGSWKGPPLWR